MTNYSTRSEFDIEKHKETFINYLKVVIHPDGSIHYAVPSHQEYMANYICKRDGITREELDGMVPYEYYTDFRYWLCMKSGCVEVWNNSVEFYKPTRAQIESLKRLEESGLFKATAAKVQEKS